MLDILDDLINRMTSMTDGDSIETSYVYDSVGNMISRTNGEGNTTRYDYDLANRVTGITNPLSQVQRMQYDIQGDLSVFTNPDGTSVRYDYDKLDALVSKNTDDEVANEALYGYDADGRQVTMDDFYGKAEYEYDGVNRIVAVTLPMEMTYTVAADTSIPTKPGQTSQENLVTVTGKARIGYHYDEWGNLDELSYPDGTSVKYSYDVLDRMTKITDRNGKETKYGYDLSGNMTSVVRPNGTHTEIKYDVMGNVTKLTNYGKNQIYGTEEVISEYTYTYDLTNYITKEVQKLGYTGTITRSYRYDNRGQLVRVSETDIAGYTTERNYKYDRNGNLIEETQSQAYPYYDKEACRTVYKYNAADQLTQKQEWNRAGEWFDGRCQITDYENDANGNRIAELDEFGNEVQYKYTVENRLKAVREGGALLFAALYDGHGDRVFQMLPHKLNEYAPGINSNVKGDPADYQVSCDTSVVTSSDASSETSSSKPSDDYWGQWGQTGSSSGFNDDYWSQWGQAGSSSGSNDDYWSQWGQAGQTSSESTSSESASSETTSSEVTSSEKVPQDDPAYTVGDDTSTGGTVCEPEQEKKNTETAPTGCGVSIDMDKLKDVMFVPNGIDHTNIDQYDVVATSTTSTWRIPVY